MKNYEIWNRNSYDIKDCPLISSKQILDKEKFLDEDFDFTNNE